MRGSMGVRPTWPSTALICAYSSDKSAFSTNSHTVRMHFVIQRDGAVQVADQILNLIAHWKLDPRRQCRCVSLGHRIADRKKRVVRHLRPSHSMLILNRRAPVRFTPESL